HLPGAPHFRMKRLASLLLVAVLLAGCTTGGAWLRSELYFGLQMPDGSHVTEQEWTAFVDEVVTPRFPDGLTILDSTGQWRNASGGIVREPGKVIVIFHSRDPALEARLDEIRRLYRERFRQESVLKATAPAHAEF